MITCFQVMLIFYLSGPNIKNQGSFRKRVKKGNKNFTTPYLSPFLSVLHQNKALHNFHKRGQPSIAGGIKFLG